MTYPVPFTPAQAAHANKAVLRLMRERRFFLYDGKEHLDVGGGHVLDPEVFAEALELNHAVRELYVAAKNEAVARIADGEATLGVVPPDLSGNKQIVEYSRYTGGLDICRVYPLADFARHVPTSRDALIGELFDEKVGERDDINDISPNAMRQYHESSEELGTRIWRDLEALRVTDPENHRSLILMKTRFSPSDGYKSGDFMEGKTSDIQDFPYGVGYLFHKRSLEARIIPHNFVVFNTSRESHVVMEHWTDGERPSLCYNRGGGYNCAIFFATVL